MKPIKISEQQKQDVMQKFQKMLAESRFMDNKITFTEFLFNPKDAKVIKPTVIFTPEAWLKMRQLVISADTEIGWHGIVNKIANDYIIEDIIVYPQTVTGTTVTTDPLEYGTWIQAHSDEIFFRIRYQGHSHVHMGCSPSGVDNHFYESILNTLQDGDFYIFMIVNKKGDINIWIHDMTQNIIFEKEDIDVMVQLPDGEDVEVWADKLIKEKVKRYVYTTPAKTEAPKTPETQNFIKPSTHTPDTTNTIVYLGSRGQRACKTCVHTAKAVTCYECQTCDNDTLPNWEPLPPAPRYDCRTCQHAKTSSRKEPCCLCRNGSLYELKKDSRKNNGKKNKNKEGKNT